MILAFHITLNFENMIKTFEWYFFCVIIMYKIPVDRHYWT